MNTGRLLSTALILGCVSAAVPAFAGEGQRFAERGEGQRVASAGEGQRFAEQGEGQRFADAGGATNNAAA